MSIVKNIYLATKDSNGVRGIFSIILVATILTVFELGMFYKIISPEVSMQIDNGINDIGNALHSQAGDINMKLSNEVINGSNSVLSNLEKQTGIKASDKIIASIQNDIRNAIKSGISNVLDTFNEREILLTKKINTYTKITGVIIIVFLSLLMYSLYYILKQRGETLGSCTWLISFITIFFILGFQYAFFRFGKSFKYIGSYGQEELLVYLLQKINV